MKEMKMQERVLVLGLTQVTIPRMNEYCAEREAVKKVIDFINSRREIAKNLHRWDWKKYRNTSSRELRILAEAFLLAANMPTKQE